MANMALRITAAALLLTSPVLIGRCAAAQAQTAPPKASPDVSAQVSPSNVPNKIIGYTSWDDEFLYVAVQVTKPALQGVNRDPFSDPLSDDAVLISLQTDNDHKTILRTAKTVTIAVSEAGGMQVYLGENAQPMFNGFKDLSSRLEDIDKNEKDPAVQQSKRLALLASVPKVQVNPIGAPRAGAGNYPGYTFEIAIPWADLGGKPDVDTKMGFNAAAISKAVGSPPLLSLSTRVHGVADTSNPALWNEIVMSATGRVPGATVLYCPRVSANKPAIDGTLGDAEWNRLSLFEFGESADAVVVHNSSAATLSSRTRAEYKLNAPRPVAVAPSIPGPTPIKPHTSGHAEQLVFATYEYDYQADARKAGGTRGVLSPDHSSALAHHPLEGTGPWFSFEDADWHRNLLSEARKEGINVVLPVYRGDPAHRRAANRGLLVLAGALEHLKTSLAEYPQVGMALDTNSLVELTGDKVDLKDATTQDALYKMIRAFYIRIPYAFRCQVSRGPDEGVAYPVFLTDPTAFKDWDGAFEPALRTRFRAEFGGADLVFVGPSGFGEKAGLDGYLPEGGGASSGGWIKCAEVSAGYDVDAARNFAVNSSSLPGRRSGETYRTSWLTAIGKHPDWVLVQRWNDFTLGGEVAPSVEAGYTGSDLTKIFTRLFSSTEKIRPRMLWSQIPSAIAAGSVISASVRLENGGSEGWGNSVTGPVSLGYRWKREGRVVTSENIAVAIGPLDPGNEITLPIKVATDKLSAGDYTLEIGLTGGKNSANWLSESHIIQATVSVGAQGVPALKVTALGVELPVSLETGSVYSASAEIRNDGATPWLKSEGWRAIARLVTITEGDILSAVPVATADASAAIDSDVAPGGVATIAVKFPLMDEVGKPTAITSPDSDVNYAIRWEVVKDGPAGQTTAAQSAPTVPGAVSELTPISIVDYDFGVRFTRDGTQPSLPVERRQPIVLGIRNNGPQTWKKDVVRVGYHWYYQDGGEFLWEDELTALPQDLAPGEGIDNLLVWVTPPPCDGNYYLEWDVKFGDTWASTTDASRSGSRLVHVVSASGGRLVFADLKKSYNLAGVSELADPTQGDFDGKGNSFPAALIPPFTDDGVVPAGVWQAYDRSGPESPRHISFRWGSKEPGNRNFVQCKGQRVDLGKGGAKCRVLHLVAASTGAPVNSNIKLVFQEPSGESEDLYAFTVNRWDQPPANGESVVFSSGRHHGPKGSVEGAVSLYHYTFTVKEPRKLVAIILPNEPDIKIAAVTVEK